MTKVVHIKDPGGYDVYIVRGSKWGNPFHIGKDGSRKMVIDKYDNYLDGQPTLLAALEELRDKVLACHCKPKPCHGDILVRRLEEPNLFLEIER